MQSGTPPRMDAAKPGEEEVLWDRFHGHADGFAALISAANPDDVPPAQAPAGDTTVAIPAQPEPLPAAPLPEVSPGLLAVPGQPERVDAIAGLDQPASRKDKSLGLLCDNFLKHFATGASDTVELESVAEKLSVGRRRIYDIVNVLESLQVVSKNKASVYTWLGMASLPNRVAQ